MGKNHARGIEVLEQLLAAGIEVHVQAVLLPDVNSGDELDATLAWIEPRSRILSAGIVPYGFTRYARMQEGFGPEGARQVIARVAPWQERSRRQCGKTRFQLADEWYLLASAPLPPAEHYDGYPQFEDGIGMLRAFEDEAPRFLQKTLAEVTKGGDKRDGSVLSTFLGDSPSCEAKQERLTKRNRPFCHLPAPTAHPPHLLFVTGEAFAPTLGRLVADTLAHDDAVTASAEVVAVPNRFFGGNVSVAGLLTAQDIIAELGKRQLPEHAVVLLPSVLFNADGLMLDDRKAKDIAQAVGHRVVVVPCTAEEALRAETGTT
jgi:NifB/MoaA-like Fe-S oxidoreductase